MVDWSVWLAVRLCEKVNLDGLLGWTGVIRSYLGWWCLHVIILVVCVTCKVLFYKCFSCECGWWFCFSSAALCITSLQILAPLPIGFAVFLVHLATIPITGTGINPARSLGAAIIFNKDHAWDDHVWFSSIPIDILLIVCSFYCLADQILSTVFPFEYNIAVDLLGWTIHWSCTGCCISPDSHQGHSLQVQGLREFADGPFFF